jgi:antitoxin component YwqK of YwqJK toxin-antitoxin module
MAGKFKEITGTRMKRYLVTLLILMAVMARGQEYASTHINKVDDQGRRQGLWKVYDAGGELKFQGVFVNDHPMGKFLYYYPNGNRKAEVTYLDSGKVDYTTMFHPNGKLMARGKHSGQKKDSTWQYFSEEDGSLVSEEIYAGGGGQGVWRTFYSSGQVAEEITYRNGIKDGPCTRYFTDGTVKSTCTYVNGMLEGLFVIHHLNGSVEVSGTYRNSKKEDVWVYLTDEGELEKKEYYRGGNLVRTESNTEDEIRR